MVRKLIIFAFTIVVLYATPSVAGKSDRYCTEMADIGEMVMKYHQYDEVSEAGAKALLEASIKYSYLSAYPESVDVVLLLIEEIYKVEVFPLKEQKDYAIQKTSRGVYMQCKTNW